MYMEQASRNFADSRLPGKLGLLFKRGLPFRLVLWGVLLTGGTAACALRSQYLGWGHALVPALSAASQVLASIAFLSYAVVKWGERREIRWLMAAAAFAIIGSSAGVRIVNTNFDLPDGYDAFAQILNAVGIISLACAGMANGRLSRKGFHVLLVAAIGGAAAVIIFRHQIGSILVVAGYTSWAGSTALGIGILGACMLVVLCHGRRYVVEGDRLAGLLVYWGVAAAVATAVGWLEPLSAGRIFWQPEALSTLASLLLIVGLGVENAMAQREAAERLEGLECLHAISWFLVGTGSLQSMLTAFAQALCERLEADFATIYLTSDEQKVLTTFAVYGLEEPDRWVGSTHNLQPQPRRGFHSGHTARAFASREIQVVSDIFSDVEFVPWQIVAERDGHVVSVPLLEGSGALGVVNLYFDSARPTSDGLLRLLQTIAAAATPAIKNAYLVEQQSYAESEVIAA